ncbi:MAG TPA: 16S rRNA (cytosine(1402)-N(4))-methyltransferase [Bacteroidetes bacterium]|jgi:16S rRNA (cytosine1402-N4)-methyltransferase|nr:16S rRNA (cytosine(1402)-N(4))-methyltransferase [Bacteroidota bacterium]
MYHDPVLRDEAAEFLVTPTGRVFVDGTVGGGGHAEEICRRTTETTRVVCFDADEDAIRFAEQRLKPFAERTLFVHSNFRNLEPELRSRGFASIDGLLLDLGVSSFQLDEASRGFSFRSNGKIDMRMDRRQPLSGWDVVNRLSDEELASILWKYGEERNSRRIAKAIVSGRPIETTGTLHDVVSSVTGERFMAKTLARIFQAIRIHVNKELENLERVLLDALQILAPGGRLVVISYHSLEDRIVKESFRKHSASVIPSGNKYAADRIVVPRLRLLTKRPVTPSLGEATRNPRARSAKLRAAERVNA